MASAGTVSAADRPPTRAFNQLGLMAYRLAWVVLFAAAVVSVGYLNARFEWQLQRYVKAGYELGFTPYQNNAAGGILLGPLDAPSRQAGIENGDLLLAIDGAAVPKGMDARYASLAGPVGSVVHLTIRHRSGKTQDIEVTRDPEREARGLSGWAIDFSTRRWIVLAVHEAAGIAGLAAALILFLRRPRSKVAQLLSISLVIEFVALNNLLPQSSALISDVQYGVVRVLMTLAVLLFPNGRLRAGWDWLALSTAIGFAVLQTFVIFRSLWTDWVVTLVVVSAGTLLIAILHRLRRTPTGTERQQIKAVLFGIAMFCTLQIVSILLTEMEIYIFSRDASAWIVLFAQATEALSGIAIPAGLLVSLLRFRLYDTESAISRSVAYGALTVMLLAIFAGSEKVVEVLGERYLGEGLGSLSAGLGAAVAAATMVPLHHRITHWAERRFQGNLVRLRKGLPELLLDLREVATPSEICTVALARLEAGVRATHGAVIAKSGVIVTRDIELGEAEHWLNSSTFEAAGADRLQVDRDDPVFPMRVPLHAEGTGRVGWLLLGPRPDGSFYGKDERETLLDIADPFGRALSIAFRRSSVEAYREAKFKSLDLRLADLEDQLRRLIGPVKASRGTA